MRIELPWPARELSPNAREHRMKVAKAKAAYRKTGWALTMEAMGVAWCPPRDGRLHLTLVFCPPDKKRRDLDNMFASMKSALDGIADATGCDDSLWTFSLAKVDPVLGGKVFITIGAGLAPDIPYRGTIS
jgi:crossover junction endodeoxyribonuclease RusA